MKTNPLLLAAAAGLLCTAAVLFPGSDAPAAPAAAEARHRQALVLADETARTQAVAELDAWYDAGLGGIFTPAEP